MGFSPCGNAFSLRSKYLIGERELSELQTSHLLEHPLGCFALNDFVPCTPSDFILESRASNPCVRKKDVLDERVVLVLCHEEVLLISTGF